jgi:hypothetical protein
MPSQPPEPRLTVDLPVRIWGMGADGRPFNQHARAQNISADGALISEVQQELKLGDIIGVQCDDKKARCTVVWLENAGWAKKNQVGVQLIAEQECPWKSYLSMEGAMISMEPSNKRRFVRHKISFPLELRDERVNTPMRINATDLSGNGCYVETILPLPVGTVLRVDFFMQSEHMSMSAVVRTCDPGVGNGIEFTGLPADGKARLQAYLDGIDPQMGIGKPG